MNLRGALTVATTRNLPKALRSLVRGFPNNSMLIGTLADLIDRGYDISQLTDYNAALRRAFDAVVAAARLRP